MYFSYEWPSINYRQVSSQTCSAIAELIKTNEHHRYLPAAKNCVKKRVFKVQNLDDTMKANIEVISRFLCATHRDKHEQFAFPDGPALLGSLHAVQQALNAVETMARGDEVEDPDATEPDSDKDTDTMKVES
ncbi:hypothetical protein B0H14DRAFT_2596189 [Mycena olivaceomarginata]|nr:hypothetical protein B0H14DRAFT_2596189 [Mycena olivaceomarginata]